MKKLTGAQFNTLHILAEFGPQEAAEVVLPPVIDGTRKVRLQWNVATCSTLAALESAGLADVTRAPLARPRDATGRQGRAR